MARPLKYPPFFESYIHQVPEDNIMESLYNQAPVIDNFLPSISNEKAEYAYAPGKWTIKEMVQHIIDTERIFCYRALCIARQEKASLPGFDENEYAKNSHGNQRAWSSLLEELKIVRKSSIFLYESFTETDLNQVGIANGKEISPLAIGFATVGHLYHHKNVLENMYLLETPL